MIAIVNIPASVQTHRYFWQAFDVALWWAVPLQWPLNWVNTPFTVQINAAALCFSEYLIAHHLSKMHFCFESTVGLMAPICWRSGVVTFKPKCCFLCVLKLLTEYFIVLRSHKMKFYLTRWNSDAGYKSPATGRSQFESKMPDVS